MKKRILPLLFLAVLCVSIFCPVSVSALTPLDPDADAALTVYYQKDGIAFADLQVEIYRVAEAFPDGSFELIDPFETYPVNIHGITVQDQWQHIAQTLWSYIVSDQVEPDRQARTDSNGTAVFAELKTGLYLVREVVAENTSGTYLFNQFLVYVPAPQPDGTYDYTVEAKPKCTNFIPNNKYTVTKLWQDGGNQPNRPTEVTVDIYKDGTLKETQILNTDNNWTYTWYVADDDHGNWTVVERSVNDSYKVTIQQNGGDFLIINYCESTPDIPQTGDAFAMLPLILMMCFSGIMLVIIAFHSRRFG